MSSRWDSAGPSGATSPPPSGNASSAAAAAAAAAAKIAAQFGTGKSQQSPTGAASAGPAPVGASGQPDKRREGNEAEFNEFIDVNDVKNRYLITRGSTQQQIHEETGASLTTKGRWYPDRNMAQPDEPPLYIHIEAATEEMLQKAIAKVNEVINSEAPQLIEERGMRGKAPTPSDRDQPRPPRSERPRWNEEKIYIHLEPMRNFHVRAKIVGPGGMFVKYIQQETGTRVYVKGRGSGFRESDTGMESNDVLHIHVTGPDPNMVAEAKTLAEDLVDAVKTEWEKSRAVLEQQGFAVPPAGGWPQGSSGYDAQAAAQGAYGQPGAQQHQQQQQQWGAAQGAIQNGGQPQQAYQNQSQYQQPTQQEQQQHHHHQQSQPTAAASSSHQEALDKYWKDYITWEDSFKAYHKRTPTKDEGGQDVPPQYRSTSSA